MAGRTLTLGVSGMLLRDGLIMFDRQTETLWTQVDGRAIRGALAPAHLEVVASVHATWKEWKRLYPNSRVLRKRGRSRSPYEAYNRNRSQLGILGRRSADDRLPGKERILGVRDDGEATAFPLARVRAAGLVHASVGSMDIVLASIADELPVLVYQRRLGDRVLTFEVADARLGLLRDVETGTRWQVSDGLAIEGPLKGSRLQRVAAHPAFWFGWRGYFPDSAVWGSATPEENGPR